MQISRLIVVIIQALDSENAIRALSAAGFQVTLLASAGGFLGTRNATLLVGLADGQEAEVVRLLEQNCRRRVEYMATPLEGAPFSLPLTTPVTVGGATIFTLTVDRYEVIT